MFYHSIASTQLNFWNVNLASQPVSAVLVLEGQQKTTPKTRSVVLQVVAIDIFFFPHLF